MYPTTRHRKPILKDQTSLFESRRQPLKIRVGLMTLAGIDMFIKGDFLFIEVRLPGFTEDEVEVLATSESLEINALKKRHPLKNKGKKYLLHESLQSFWRHLTLPPGAKWEELNYIIRNDKLIITMPIVANEFQQNGQSKNSHFYSADYPTKNLHQSS